MQWEYWLLWFYFAFICGSFEQNPVKSWLGTEIYQQVLQLTIITQQVLLSEWCFLELLILVIMIYTVGILTDLILLCFHMWFFWTKTCEILIRQGHLSTSIEADKVMTPSANVGKILLCSTYILWTTIYAVGIMTTFLSFVFVLVIIVTYINSLTLFVFNEIYQAI